MSKANQRFRDVSRTDDNYEHFSQTDEFIKRFVLLCLGHEQLKQEALQDDWIPQLYLWGGRTTHGS
jgi:hypothetical protein